MFTHARVLGVVISIILLAVPFISSAVTVEELQAQINELLQQLHQLQQQAAEVDIPVEHVTVNAPNSCVNLEHNLFLGTSDAQVGGEVSALQRFLTITGDFTHWEVTGYFGPATEAALRQWQCREMQLCSGSPDSNGWGVVGPKTRALLKTKCPAAANAQEAPANAVAGLCPLPPTKPDQACYGTWQRINNAQGCQVAWQCAITEWEGTDVRNMPPVIHSIDGPTSILPKNGGTWVVRATDPEGDKLTYGFAWGDEPYQSPLYFLSYDSRVQFLDSNVRTHTYTTAGSRLLTVTVRDEKGNEASAYLLIRVAYSALTPVNGVESRGDDGGHLQCAADTKRCPNGTYVSRVSPSCEFAACSTIPAVETEGIDFTTEGGTPQATTCPSLPIPTCNDLQRLEYVTTAFQGLQCQFPTCVAK